MNARVSLTQGNARPVRHVSRIRVRCDNEVGVKLAALHNSFGVGVGVGVVP